ncbi:MAG: CDP-alcohol phosphatidyltransferase family protein [Planctomycetota bacterium]|jgi:CDP-diacylglycerol--glycerol-3-phosphate 3-phosphatidyltransferase
MSPRQIPNLITLARLALAVAAFWWLERVLDAVPGTAEVADPAFWAFWFFLVAAVTDWLDGWLARRNGWVTAIGRVADPVVDKVLTLGALIYLGAGAQYGRADDLQAIMPVWAVVVLIAREFLVTALRGLVESRGMQFPADRYGKAKMLTQVIYICIAIAAAGAVPERIGLPFLDMLRHPMLVAVLFWAMLALAVMSGLNYCVKGARMLSGEEADRA